MIQIKNLSFSYKKNAPLFRELELEFSDGHIVGLLGKNGAGKSTLLGLMAGLLQNQSGSIMVNNHIPFQRYPAFLADIYMVPEEFVFQNVTINTYVKAYAPLYPGFDNQKLYRIFEAFELKPESKLNKLSHGQRKKFLIAFALSTNCRLLIFDEPTNGLDIPSKSQFRKILVSSVSDEQLVIISTHQVKDIDTIIDTVVVIDEGKFIYNKNTDAIAQELYFGIVPTFTDKDAVIYSEKCTSGYRIIQPLESQNESTIDLELLFNAIINHKI